MADTTWTIKHFDRNGNAINANYASYSGLGSSNEIYHATDRTLEFNLNGIDTAAFSLYLDDPMAAQIKRLTSYIKIWRNVPGYSDPSNTPCFAGVVANHRKDGNANLMQVQAYSPFWRLQTRFHIRNHYLKTNPDTAADYKQSELIWRLIKYINNAWGIGSPISYTGIVQGTFYDVGSEITMAPYFQPKGANVWTEIFDGILARAASVDIIPRYHHTNGSSTVMYLDTALKRGSDRSASVSFEYHTSSPSNCDNVVEEEQVFPNKFGNYVWAVGQGGPNSGKLAIAEDTSSINEGYNAIGIYMVRNDYRDEKRLGVVGPPPTHLRANAINDLARSIVPDLNYEVEVSPAATIYYGKDFSIGDVINLNASKGALSVSNKKQRVYECTLRISDNNIETISPKIAKDFTGKVAT